MKTLILAITLTFLAPITNAYASPCNVTLCMFGVLSGAGGGNSCTSSINEFFAISVSSGFISAFNPEATKIARKTFLKKCDSADSSKVDSIISAFGTAESL